MSDYLNRPVYDDVEAEARADWRAEKSDDVRPEDVLDRDELEAYYATEPPARAFRVGRRRSSR